ncbi:MAG: hypothetical protein LBR31_04015 [Desulfovibrio sp.]|jgi:hypothetical protein|nr:hypothetical protein [Desulfovibrio sp.]
MDLHGIDSAIIPVPDAGVLKDCIRAMIPERHGLKWLDSSIPPREFDVCFMGRGRYIDHCGVAVQTTSGLMILHCMQWVGVELDRPVELMAVERFVAQKWARHPALLADDEVHSSAQAEMHLCAKRGACV